MTTTRSRRPSRALAIALLLGIVVPVAARGNGPGGPEEPPSNEARANESATPRSLFAWNSRSVNRVNENGLLDVRRQAFGVLVQTPCGDCDGTLPRVYTPDEYARRSAAGTLPSVTTAVVATIGETCSDSATCTGTPSCSDGNQCTEGPFCSNGAVCTSGEGCSEGGDCTLGPNCSAGATCTQGQECSTGWDCTAGGNCSHGTECTQGPDCSEGRDCTEGTNCSTGTNCTNGQQCSDHDECTTEGKCTEGTNCSTGNECTSHDGCSDQSASCTDATECSTEANCSNGGHCPPTKGMACTQSSTCLTSGPTCTATSSCSDRTICVYPVEPIPAGAQQLIASAVRGLDRLTGIRDGGPLVAMSGLSLLLLPLGAGVLRRRREEGDA